MYVWATLITGFVNIPLSLLILLCTTPFHQVVYIFLIPSCIGKTRESVTAYKRVSVAFNDSLEKTKKIIYENKVRTPPSLKHVRSNKNNYCLQKVQSHRLPFPASTTSCVNGEWPLAAVQ